MLTYLQFVFINIIRIFYDIHDYYDEKAYVHVYLLYLYLVYMIFICLL